jgi:hypothetical protein
MKIKWVVNTFLKKRDRLTPQEFDQRISYSQIDLLKEIINTKKSAWGEIEKIVILRKDDSDKIYDSLKIRIITDTTGKEVKIIA